MANYLVLITYVGLWVLAIKVVTRLLDSYIAGRAVKRFPKQYKKMLKTLFDKKFIKSMFKTMQEVAEELEDMM